MTLTDWQQAHPETDLFKGTNYDETSQSQILARFAFRFVCDNDKFGAFFNRELILRNRQYNQYLRTETVEFDPMVSDYVERQILRDDTQAGTVNATQNETSNGTVTDTDSTTGNGTTSTTRHDEGTSNRKLVSENTSSNTQSGTSKQTNSGNDKTVENSSTETDRSTTNTTTSTSTQTAEQDAQALQGTTPDSSVYPAAGFPEGLAWQYASGQSETKSSGTTENTGNDETHINENGSDTVNRTSTLTHGHIIDSTDSGTSSGTINGTSTEDGTTENDGTEQVTRNDTTTREHESESTGTRQQTTEQNDNRTISSDTRERTSGRHEAPQDMLQRAVDFITGCNAMAWLLAHLDSCFMAIYSD